MAVAMCCQVTPAQLVVIVTAKGKKGWLRGCEIGYKRNSDIISQ